MVHYFGEYYIINNFFQVKTIKIEIKYFLATTLALYTGRARNLEYSRLFSKTKKSK